MTGHPTIMSYAISLAMNLLIIGAFLAAATALAFRALPSAPSRLRYLIAVTLFLAAAFLPIYLSLHKEREPIAPRMISPSDERQENDSAVANRQPNDTNRKEKIGRAEQIPEHFTSTDTGRPAIFEQGTLLLNTVVRIWAPSWVGIAFFVIWVVISILLLCREAAGHMRLSRRRRTWRPADRKTRASLTWPGWPPLYLSIDERSGTLGFFRPVVVLPADLIDGPSPEAVRLIARHELAHARWRDPLVNTVLRIIRAVFWPSFPLWYLERIIRFEREVAADQFALTGLRHLQREEAAIEYAAVLLSVARRSQPETGRWGFAGVATEAGGRTNLENRVRRLLRPHQRTTPAHLLLAVFTLALGIGAAGLSPVTANPFVAGFNSPLEDLANLDSAPHAESNPSRELQPNSRDNLRNSSLPALLPQNKEESQGEIATHPSPQAGADGALQQQDNLEETPPLQATGDHQKEEGVTQDFMDGMARLGYVNLSPDQLVAMRDYDVNPSYVKEMAASGYNKLTADALINFRWLGINSSYIKEVKELGFRDLSPNTLIDFRLYGVTSSYIRELAGGGFSNLPAKTLVAFRRQGIRADYLSRLRATVTTPISTDQLLGLQRAGVTIGYLKDLKVQGYGHLTVDQLMEMRGQGSAKAKTEKE